MTPITVGQRSVVCLRLEFPCSARFLRGGSFFLLQGKPAEKDPDTRQKSDQSNIDGFFALAKISSWISVILVLLPRLMSFLLISTRELAGVIGNIMAVFAFGHFLIGIVLALSAAVIGVCFFVLAVISCRWKKTFWPFGFALAYITTGVFNFLYQFSFLVLWTGGV